MTDDLKAKFVALDEFVSAARERLDANSWEYLIGGAETETTIRRNRHAIESVGLRPRVLNDVSSTDAWSEQFGAPIRLPVILGPVGGLEAFDPRGALAVAEAAREFRLPMTLSSVSKIPMESVRDAAGDVAIFQLYVRGDEAWLDAQVERVVAAGYQAFCLTVDSAIYGRRERDTKKRFDKPWRSDVDNEAVFRQAALSWSAVERIKKKFDIPLILKGIATAEDARLAVEHGVDVVYVTNHGGRQIDHGLGGLAVLPEVLEAVEGEAKVWVDGGFCRGSDIVKALALGADAVGIARIYCYALAAAGAPGIVRMLEILETEIHTTLGLLGVSSPGELSRDHLSMGAPVVNEVGVLGAFPLLKTGDDL